MANLNKLSLKACNLSKDSSQNLLDGLSKFNKSLKKLNLSNNNIEGVSNIGKFLKEHRQIEVLKLSKSSISDSELK
jgi:hypothetical protein